MVKFFKKEPKQCSICGEIKPIKKKVFDKGHTFYYCQDCWNKTYGVAKTKIYEQVKNAKLKKQTIGLKELKQISDDIIKEL